MDARTWLLKHWKTILGGVLLSVLLVAIGVFIGSQVYSRVDKWNTIPQPKSTLVAQVPSTTVTETSTQTQTPVQTPSNTYTKTKTPTVTATNTELPTATLTSFPWPRTTNTPIATTVPTINPTETKTPEHPTATPTKRSLPTQTPVQTPRPTATHLPSPIPTQTRTQTTTPTTTPSATATKVRGPHLWTKQTSFSKSELPVNIGIHGAGFDTSDINLIFLYLHFKDTTVSDVVYVSPDGTFNINKYFTLERSMLGDNPTCHIQALVYQGPNHPGKVLATLDINVTQ